MRYCSLFGDHCFKLNLMCCALSIPNLRSTQKRFKPPSPATVAILHRFAAGFLTVPAEVVRDRPRRRQAFDRAYQNKQLHKTLAVFES